jgi:hypothetical protein
MLIKAKTFEHYNNYSFKIPLLGGERIYVKNNQQISAGDSLFSKTDNRIKESYFVVDEFGCKPTEAYKYINCIDGSYVEKGEELAQKTSRNGLTVKKIVSGVNGIVDMSRISKGFIDILAEEEEMTVESNFLGTVSNVLPGSHIEINSPASVLDLAATTSYDKKIFGNILFLAKERDVLSRVPDVDLKGKIVWAGAYLPRSLAYKVFKKGARAILTYSMEYEDFRDLGLPVGVIEGFGKIHCDEKFFEQLYKMDKKFAVLDGSENQLFIAKETQRKKDERQYFVKELLGAQVISRHSAHYGYIGNIIQINDLNYVTVDFGISGKSIVDLGSLDFISL